MKQYAAQTIAWPPKPTVAGHRGAPAFRPEHTLASYQRAIDDGADLIEPDLVVTRDGVLVARHENEISGTTNVADKPAFADRRTTKSIDGVSVTGWFTEDFTLAELKTLKATERIPLNRPANVAYDNLFEIPTLQEIIDLAQQQSRALGRVIGIYPETKHPSYFQSIGLALEQRLVTQLHANGYNDANAPVLIQSFEVTNLKALHGMTAIRLVQLIDAPGNRPYDFTIANDPRTYADLISPAGLKEITSYADIIAPHKEAVIPRDAYNELGTPTAFVEDAHAAGLQVHVYTMRPENPFLPTSHRKNDVAAPSGRGDSQAEIEAYLEAEIDGFFTDDSAVGRAAVAAFLKKR
ncbi:MAG: glycerophosphodiester phosphodiesterase [Pseudomonadota bacterium]